MTVSRTHGLELTFQVSHFNYSASTPPPDQKIPFAYWNFDQATRPDAPL